MNINERSATIGKHFRGEPVSKGSGRLSAYMSGLRRRFSICQRGTADLSRARRSLRFFFQSIPLGACVFSAFLLLAPMAWAQNDTEQPTQSDDTRRNQGADKRRNQNIDEPRLFPMFGRARGDDEPDQIEDEEDSRRVRPLRRGFTSILTLIAPEETDLSLGVGPVYQPDYFGSDDYEIEADPQVYIRVRNFVFFDDDGADIALFGFSGFRFGPSIRLVGDRDENDNPNLAGLDRIGQTFELGGFAAATFVDRYSVKFKVRQGVATGHRGLIVDAFGTALLFKYGRFSTSVSAQASWIGDDYADAFFTITPDQSIRSGLPVFDADDGFRNIGGSLNGYLNLGKRWSLNPYVTYNLIIGDAADTPIVSQLGSRHQFRAGFHLIRQFKLF